MLNIRMPVGVVNIQVLGLNVFVNSYASDDILYFIDGDGQYYDDLRPIPKSKYDKFLEKLGEVE